MIIEILEKKAVKIDGKVQVDYMDGRTAIYDSETTKHLILNPGSIVAISISEKKK